MSNFKNRVILEHSNNTHIAESDGKILTEQLEGNQIKVTPEETISVNHGEHGTIVMDKPFVKVNQVEYNPVTRAMQQAFD